ncbi:MAG: hypothetical protein WCW36_01665 [Candidatus Paceibacterota bacterium]
MVELWTEENRTAAFAIFEKIARNNREWLIDGEIGTEVELRPIGHEEYSTNGYSGLSLLYITRVPSKAIATHEKRRWFNANALPEPMLEEHKAIIEQLVAHL